MEMQTKTHKEMELNTRPAGVTVHYFWGEQIANRITIFHLVSAGLVFDCQG